VISTNYLINPNNMPIQTPVQLTGQNQATVASPSSGGSNDVNKLLNDASLITNSLRFEADRNEQAQKAKEAQEAQKLMQQQYLAALPANQPNASQPSGTSPSTVMPRSASVPASDSSNPVEWAKNVASNAWNEANQLIAGAAQSATQFVTGAPAQAATMPTPAMPNASTSTSTGGGASGNGGFINPLPSGKATSGFGMRNHPVHGGQKMHNGQDLAAPMGTAIQAAADGEVTINAFEGKGYGNWIEIKHPNGKSTRYGHMKDKSPLAVGTKVTQGQVIGAVGSTGASTGPHLHFEIRNSAGKAENPVAYLPNEKSKTA
jgi:murein DD-endopeptidase MepM/ murein hydrolase activator NlpD